MSSCAAIMNGGSAVDFEGNGCLPSASLAWADPARCSRCAGFRGRGVRVYGGLVAVSTQHSGWRGVMCRICAPMYSLHCIAFFGHVLLILSNPLVHGSNVLPCLGPREKLSTGRAGEMQSPYGVDCGSIPDECFEMIVRCSKEMRR